MTWEILLYFWVVFWVAFITFGSYNNKDPMWKMLIGPLVFGLVWPLSLPLVALGNKGPDQYILNIKRILRKI